MADLTTLQYPRHVHKGARFLIVTSPAECDAALDDGWVVSPGDTPRTAPKPIVAQISPDEPESAPVKGRKAPKTRTA